MDRELAAAVDELLNRRATVGLAVGIVRDGRLDWFRGDGVADIDSGRPITADTGFRIASITKTFTAVAIAQLWESGRIDLDAPAEQYLRSFRLVPARPEHRPATVRQLLTHTAGLGELAHPAGAFRPDFGEGVPAGERVPTLAEFYAGRLQLRAEPGTRFVYNNHGPATLGQIVEDVTGQSLRSYLRTNVFEPLGMADTDLRRTDRVRAILATGYEIGRHGVRRVEDREMATSGAAAAFSTPADMARYLAALLDTGGPVLSPATTAELFAPQYQPHPRIPGVGLGFFRDELGGQPVVGHQGTYPGYHSRILLAPGRGAAAMAFTNGANGADFWLPVAVSRLLGLIIGAPPPTVHTDAAQRPHLWAELCGWYGVDAAVTDVRLRGIMGLGIEVYVAAGRLMLRFLNPVPALARGLPLLPDDPADPYVFAVELGDSGLDPMRVVFERGPDGTAARLHLDLMPVTLERRPDAANPRRWGLAGAAALGAAAAVAVARRASR